MGDFNIDKKETSIAYKKLEEFCDTFNFTNIHKSTIDLF